MIGESTTIVVPEFLVNAVLGTLVRVGGQLSRFARQPVTALVGTGVWIEGGFTAARVTFRAAERRAAFHVAARTTVGWDSTLLGGGSVPLDADIDFLAIPSLTILPDGGVAMGLDRSSIQVDHVGTNWGVGMPSMLTQPMQRVIASVLLDILAYLLEEHVLTFRNPVARALVAAGGIKPGAVVFEPHDGFAVFRIPGGPVKHIYEFIGWVRRGAT